MNRDEKNLQTRRKIVDSALIEFSENGYEQASMNSVCVIGNISKGIIYHYFKDKNELYLICVNECFDALTDFLADALTTSKIPIEAALENYFEVRINFFAKNPLYLKLFCNVMMSPPFHLLTALAEVKAKFDALNLSVLSSLLENANLRSDITIAEVVEIFREYQDFINTRFQMQTSNEIALKEHEERCRRSLKILLYGVLEREAQL